MTFQLVLTLKLSHLDDVTFDKNFSLVMSSSLGSLKHFYAHLLNEELNLFLLIASYCTFVAKAHYHSLSIQALPAFFSLLFYSLSKFAAQSVRALTLGLCRVECRRFKPCSMLYFLSAPFTLYCTSLSFYSVYKFSARLNSLRRQPE